MPPSRRHSRTTTSPPVRRPRVAGMRRRSGASTPERSEPAKPVEPPSLTVAAAPDTVEPEPARVEPEHSADLVDQVDQVDEQTDAKPDTIEPAAAAKPTGKPRATGETPPGDLTEAEAEVGHPAVERSRPHRTLIGSAALVVLAVILAGLAVWFRGEANSLSEGADTNNQALTDTARASEAIGQLRGAVEKTLTYNYTDLESTARAVRENLAGKALCEYDQLFGQVRELAPEQKLVLTTRVREIGITRLEGDQALLLVFVDQTTTRADQNQTTASGAQFVIKAERQDGTWKITQFDMLGQPLPNGQPAPQC